MAAPCVLVASCCPVSPSDIIKQILKKEELPPSTHITDGIVGYPWSIENKYYTAQVEICSTPCKTIGDAAFAERLEAVIVIFEDKTSSFDSVKQWMPFIDQLSPTTQILACQQFTLDGEVSRQSAQLWCLDNSFELVELERAEEDEDEDEDEYDITGVQRIISALHAHTWSNLELKERRGIFGLLQSEVLSANRQHSDEESANEGVIHPTPPPDTETQPRTDSNTQLETDSNTQPRTDTAGASASPLCDTDGRTSEKQVDNTTANDTTDSHAADEETNHLVHNGTGAESKTDKENPPSGGGAASTQDRIDNLLNDDMQLFRALGSEDPGDESFESLFSRMAAMKERAAGLSGEERKKYAEKVAISFWRALGGDEEEVDGLEDSD